LVVVDSNKRFFRSSRRVFTKIEGIKKFEGKQTKGSSTKSFTVASKAEVFVRLG
jgi:hypothetical protein